MSEKRITLLKDLKSTPDGADHWLYYYQGNFFYPLSLFGRHKGRAARAIRMFKYNHRAMVDNDRAHPDYKTLVELFDEQMCK